MAVTLTTGESGRSVEGMDNRTEARDFLASRRARYSAEPGTSSADNLALLASWAATNVEAAPAQTSANDH
jgi:hypothetical protein